MSRLRGILASCLALPRSSWSWPWAPDGSVCFRSPPEVPVFVP
jgi:hypothetical protein